MKERQGQLLRQKSLGKGGIPYQVCDFEMVGWSSPNFLVRCLGIVKNEVAIGRIKTNEHFGTGQGTPNGIVVVTAADANLSGVADFALPCEGRQIGIHPLEVKMSQFLLGTKGSSRLKEVGVGLDGRFSSTAFSMGREFISQFKDGLVYKRLETGQWIVFIAHNGILGDSAMATFDFGIVGRFARSDQRVLYPQSFEPEGEGTGKAVLA